MIKSFLDFFTTGALVIIGYFIYFVSAVIITVILGIPIAFAIKIIVEIMNILFNGV